MSEPGPPSSFFVEQLGALREAARRGPILDLACGRGRHALATAREGLPTLGLDRRLELLAALSTRVQREALRLSLACFDLERGLAPPLREARCGAVLVFRYLHRPLAPSLERLLAPGGVLLYETFTRDQRELRTGPRNPDFLLEPGELPRLFPGLEIGAYEEGLHDGAMTARLVARLPG